MVDFSKEAFDRRRVTYNDEQELRDILVGRRIVETHHRNTEEAFPVKCVEFILDNGTILEARETWGCSCGSGEWSVESPSQPESVITNVSVVDEITDEWGESAILRMYVYSDGIPTEVIRSQGSDNGYYGWGYEVHVRVPRVEA